MSAFTGTVPLVRLALHRDRARLSFWILGMPVLASASAASVIGLYDTEQARMAYATTTAASAVARAFNGPASGPNLGAIVMAESFATLTILTALLSTFAMIRHTRQNEETGRSELIGSAVVGRYAQLTAALVVTAGVNVLVGLLVALVLIANRLPATGSFAAGALTAGVGVSFAGLAAIAAQIPGTARGANGLAAAAIGVAFGLRAAGDTFGDLTSGGVRVVSTWPSWCSPLGWGNQVRAFDSDRWWVLALPVGLFVLATAVAFVLSAHRDVGAGMLATRRGPATGSARLLSPLGLAWRLQRGALTGWAVALVALGVGMGAVGDEVDDLLADNPAGKAVFAQPGAGAGLTDAYLATMVGFFGLGVAGYAVQALLRMHAEETGGTLEAVLATAVSRPRWWASHILCTGLGVVALLALAGAATGLGYGFAVGDLAVQTARVAGAGLVQAPAVLAFAGLVTAIFGLLPRWAAALSWAVLTVCVLLGQIGGLLDLPQPVLDLSPFTHTPAVPATDLRVLPVVALLAVAAALGGTALALFRRRDLAM